MSLRKGHGRRSSDAEKIFFMPLPNSRNLLINGLNRVPFSNLLTSHEDQEFCIN